MNWVSLQLLKEKANGLSLRERAIAASTLMIGTVVVVFELIWSPWLAEIDDLSSKIDRAKSQQETQITLITALEERLSEDPDELIRAQNEVLSRQLQEQERVLVKLLGRLVKPAEIVGLLEQVLEENADLKVTGVQSLPVMRIYESEAANDEGNASPPVYASLYSHKVRINIEAEYFSTLAYLKRLENLESGLLFKLLDYRVDRYPRANVTLLVETIGLKKEWLGV